MYFFNIDSSTLSNYKYRTCGGLCEIQLALLKFVYHLCEEPLEYKFVVSSMFAI